MNGKYNHELEGNGAIQFPLTYKLLDGMSNLLVSMQLIVHVQYNILNFQNNYVS